MWQQIAERTRRFIKNRKSVTLKDAKHQFSASRKQLGTTDDHFMNTFKLSNEQIVKVNEWMSKHVAQYTGAIGGRYTYSFCPTTLGVLVKITDSVTNEILDVTEYDGW